MKVISGRSVTWWCSAMLVCVLPSIATGDVVKVVDASGLVRAAVRVGNTSESVTDESVQRPVSLVVDVVLAQSDSSLTRNREDAERFTRDITLVQLGGGGGIRPALLQDPQSLRFVEVSAGTWELQGITPQAIQSVRISRKR